MLIDRRLEKAQQDPEAEYETETFFGPFITFEPSDSIMTRLRGNTYYELSNHLGNVLSVITDRKLQVCASGDVMYYQAQVVSVTDYYPFGMEIKERTWQASEYGHGFNGMEKDDEVSGSGNSYSTEFRELDTRIGRWWSIDPNFRKFAWQSPYNTFNNNPIYYQDPTGLEGTPPGDDKLKSGKQRRQELRKARAVSKFEKKIKPAWDAEFNRQMGLARGTTGDPRTDYEAAEQATLQVFTNRYSGKNWFDVLTSNYVIIPSRKLLDKTFFSANPYISGEGPDFDPTKSPGTLTTNIGLTNREPRTVTLTDPRQGFDDQNSIDNILRNSQLRIDANMDLAANSVTVTINGISFPNPAVVGPGGTVLSPYVTQDITTQQNTNQVGVMVPEAIPTTSIPGATGNPDSWLFQMIIVTPSPYLKIKSIECPYIYLNIL